MLPPLNERSSSWSRKCCGSRCGGGRYESVQQYAGSKHMIGTNPSSDPAFFSHVKPVHFCFAFLFLRRGNPEQSEQYAISRCCRKRWPSSSLARATVYFSVVLMLVLKLNVECCRGRCCCWHRRNDAILLCNTLVASGPWLRGTYHTTALVRFKPLLLLSSSSLLLVQLNTACCCWCCHCWCCHRRDDPTTTVVAVAKRTMAPRNLPEEPSPCRHLRR